MSAEQAEKQKRLLHAADYVGRNPSRTGYGVEWYAPDVDVPIGMGFAAYTVDGTITAVEFVHLTPAGEPCGGFLWMDHAYTDTPFQVVREEPLTLSPSLHCARCDTHGFVQEGRWVPA